ncbi:quinate transport [Fusarium mundagurra]|uniref:Quinate transport n=1 Tax=Fusarium mundagurra TaxID=1567541 RepID=A0A8H5XTR3_9HYPO|nr:quinate transport [Fusarium mundagurra]
MVAETYSASGKSPKDDLSVENVENLATTASGSPVGHSEEDISYGPGGIRGVVASPYIFGAAFLASMGGFSFGYDQGVISIVNVMHQFHAAFPRAETAFGKGLMTGMLELGAFIGCLFMPTLADKISRKKALSIVVVIFNIGAIMQTAANSYGLLVAGRTIGGIGVGTLAMGAPIYISEIAPPNLRGTLLVLESVSCVLGVVVSFWITYATRDLPGEISFRLPFGLQMVCSTILGVGVHFFPYSPRWLALVDRSDDALNSLQRLRRLPGTDYRVQKEHAAIMNEVAIQKRVQEMRHPGATGLKLEVLGWADLFKKNMWHRTSIAVGVAFFQQLSGINAFIYYAPTLFQSLGQSSEMSLIMSGVFNMLQLVAVTICFFIIDKVGRRPLAIFGGIGGGTAWGIMAVLVGVFNGKWSSNPAAGWAAVAMAFCFILIYGVTYAPLGWALPAEVYPNASRSKGVALATATVWLFNFIVGVATPPMIESIGFGVYIFFGSWCFLAGAWAFFLVPETKGKTLEQMDEVFGDNAAQEEMAMMR